MTGQTCGAPTRAGGHCANPPMRGATKCRIHGDVITSFVAAILALVKAEHERDDAVAEYDSLRVEWGELVGEVALVQAICEAANVAGQDPTSADIQTALTGEATS